MKRFPFHPPAHTPLKRGVNEKLSIVRTALRRGVNENQSSGRPVLKPDVKDSQSKHVVDSIAKHRSTHHA